MKILGIDPGSRKTGFGLIEKKGTENHYLFSTTLEFADKDNFLDRVEKIHSGTLDILKLHRPEIIAIESLIYVKSPTALIKLAQTRGIILAAISQINSMSKVFEYSPNLIKSQTIGHGHGDKKSGQQFIKRYFGIEKFKSDDESDALLVALCHSFSGNRIRVVNKKGSRSLASSLAHKL